MSDKEHLEFIQSAILSYKPRTLLEARQKSESYDYQLKIIAEHRKAETHGGVKALTEYYLKNEQIKQLQIAL
jgi:hypothetical protein